MQRHTRRLARSAVIAAVVGGAGLVAYALPGASGVAFQPPADVIVSDATGSADTIAIANSSTSDYSVALAADVSCDDAIGFSAAGSSAFALAAAGSQNLSLSCGSNHAPGLARCVIHAIDTTNGSGLADGLAVCEYATASTLAPSVPSLDFGSVAVGDESEMTVTLTNTDAATIAQLGLQTTDLAGNFGLAAPCNPDVLGCDANVGAIATGQAATITVRCTPQTTGVHTASLVVATDTAQALSQAVSLTCTGTAATGPALGATPLVVEAHDPIEVLAGSASATVALTNIGTGTLMLTDVRAVDVDAGAALDWALLASGKCGGTVAQCVLAHGDEVDLALTFDPSEIGTRRASLLVSYHDTLDRTLAIPLDGIGAGATLAYTGTAVLDLGAIPLGHTGSATLAIANQGNRNTTAMLELSPPGAPFAISPTTSLTVTPNAAATVTIACTPSTTTTAMTTFTAQGSDLLSGSPLTIVATCTGSTAPLFAMPPTIALGEVRTGGGPIVTTVQLDSTAAPLMIASTSLDTANSSIAVGSAVAASTPTSFTVTVDPQVEGVLADHVVVIDKLGDTLRIPITGTIVTPAFTVPISIDLGTFCVGQPTTPSNALLTSTGTGTIGLSAPAFASPTSPFDLSLTAPTTYPTTLPAQRSATVAITPQRRGAPATESDVLTWSTDVTGQLAATTSVTAAFIDTGGAIAPPSLDFGTVPPHILIDDGQRVTIQNCNATPLQLIPPVVSQPFSIDSPSFPQMLAPGESATFSVGFHPTAAGSDGTAYDDTLVISSPQLPSAPLMVQLHGVAKPDSLPPDGGTVTDPATPGSSSFYACSCHAVDPPSAAPIVLALALVLRRRGRRGTRYSDPDSSSDPDSDPDPAL